MRIKGFTLIELLAVIVILAIIALIAVPIVLNIVSSSKESSVVRSGELYLKGVEISITKENLNSSFYPKSCTIKSDGNLTCIDINDKEKDLIIEVKGSKPTKGEIFFEQGAVIKVNELIIDGYELEKKEKEKLKLKGPATNVPVSDPYTDPILNGADPKLTSGLVAVTYDGTNWKVADTTQQWYNYTNQEWANAIVLKSGVKKNIGDTVDVSSEVQGMFVWIPRYEYKIEGQYGTHSDGTSGTQDLPGEIKVNFISKSVTTASNGYHINSAFTFGTENLNGIWVGKFETTGDSDNPTVLPGVESFRGQIVSEKFNTARLFNNYLDSKADAHMSKNSEWGAVAYLSQSKYGKYGNDAYAGASKEVMLNNCTFFYTGIGANPDDDSDSPENCTTNTYETTMGKAASTTGNITGVYDMAGGSEEAVMAVYNKTSRGDGFTDATWPEEKYYDNYTTSDISTTCNGKVCYGHALSETSGWYNDYGDYVTEYPWISRGGFYIPAPDVGIFFYESVSGVDEGELVSFRITIAIN